MYGEKGYMITMSSSFLYRIEGVNLYLDYCPVYRAHLLTFYDRTNIKLIYINLN